MTPNTTLMIIIKFSMNLPKNFTGITFDSSKVFCKNKQWHRFYGPALISSKNNTKKWFFNDQFFGTSYEKYNQSIFIKDLNKLWFL